MEAFAPCYSIGARILNGGGCSCVKIAEEHHRANLCEKVRSVCLVDVSLHDLCPAQINEPQLVRYYKIVHSRDEARFVTGCRDDLMDITTKKKIGDLYMVTYVGQQFGNYRLLKLLGEGGFAEVYLGEHIHLRTPAAIKVLTTKLAEEEIEQFRNEARIMIGLMHPHIMRVLDFGLHGHIPFIVMDYAPNGTLRKMHPKGTSLPIPTIVNYVRQIAAALQHVHNQKLIHRDVKPENMLLGRQNEVVLSDFGITAVAHSTRSLKTQDGSGTIYYMAPEQIQGKPRPASDQYSLGVVVYEWLSGVRPFNGTYWEIASQHLSTHPPSLCGRVSSIPPNVEEVVMKALSKDPKQRYSNIEDFAQALEQAYQKPTVGTLLCTYKEHSFSKINQYISPEDQWQPSYIYSHVASSCCPVWTVAWSLDGTRIASGSYSIHIWNASTGNHMVSYQDGKTWIVNSVKWSPNCIHLASGTTLVAQVWDTTRGDAITTYRDQFVNLDDVGHDAIPFTFLEHPVSWSPDGTRIASACDTIIVQVWDAATGNALFSYKCPSPSSTLKHADWISAIEWSPDGKYIAAAAAPNVFVWEVATRQRISTYPTYHCSLAWSPNSKYIASSIGAEVHIWNAATGKLILRYQEGSFATNDISWSPDGRYIASAHGSTVHIWNPVLGNHIYTYQGHALPVNAVA